MDEDENKKVFAVKKVVEGKPEDSTETARPQLKETQEVVEATPVTKPTKPWQRVQFSQIPTQKIFQTMTNPDMMRQTLHDETLEPHVHIAILLLIVMILAIIITLLGL